MPDAQHPALTLSAIGVVHSPFNERVDAPRQPVAAEGVRGRVELFPGRGYEDALTDLALWDHLWLVVWFHHNATFRPKVQPPRSQQKRGVLATRAPYRPNPIGLSAVRLLGVEGLTLHVAGLDLLDQTPLLDVKPYVPYTDAIPGANHGWLDQERGQGARPADPIAPYVVQYAQLAREQLSFLAEEHALDLSARIEPALRLGPSPHAYRRIRRSGDGFCLAVKDWRVFFQAHDKLLTVSELKSGYRPRALFGAEDAAPPVHRAFVSRWPKAF